MKMDLVLDKALENSKLTEEDAVRIGHSINAKVRKRISKSAN